MLRFLVSLLALVGFCIETPRAAENYDAAFRTFLSKEIVPLARSAGVSQATLDRELAGLTPDTSLPGLAKPGKDNVPPKVNYQAEFRAPGAYFSDKQFNALVGRGRSLLKSNAATLQAIEASYKVPKGILLAIWARETGYGSAKLPYDGLRVVATQAFMGQRQAFYRDELVAALKILHNGDIARARFKSSWGGALGQPQFLPSSFLKYAVDFDRDGHRDIWNSVADTLASIANYLDKNGWVAGRDWGFEVAVPGSVSCSREGPDRGQPIARWQSEGVERVSGRPFPAHEVKQSGFLLMPAGRYGPAFLATENFYVLKTYNESDVYALFVGHLADRYGSGGGFVQPWKKTPVATRGEVRARQQKLEAQGHDVGGADGLIGFKTRRTFGLVQEASGKAATCWIN